MCQTVLSRTEKNPYSCEAYILEKKMKNEYNKWENYITCQKVVSAMENTDQIKNNQEWQNGGKLLL